MSKGDIRLKRAYDDATGNDGKRVLVDGMWPRGVTKEKAALEEWFKPIAPSKELLKWFGHDPDKWTEFKKRYKKELESGEQKVYLDRLRELYEAGRVTLVFAAKNEWHNNAVVLKEVLQDES